MGLIFSFVAGMVVGSFAVAYLWGESNYSYAESLRIAVAASRGRWSSTEPPSNVTKERIEDDVMRVVHSLERHYMEGRQ